MRNILAKVPHREKGRFAAHLKRIWLEPDKERISSTIGQERLNMEIRQRIRVVGVFRPVESCARLTICYLIEYAEDWASERSYIREDKVIGSLDRLHELTAQAAN